MIRSRWLCIALAVALPPVGAKALIFDGMHNTGNPYFYFLPPMVAAPILPGSFDPTLDPVVEIEHVSTHTLVAGFTTDDGVRIDDDGSAYIAIWRTSNFNLASAQVYRVGISVDGVYLGFADIALVDSPASARNVDTGEFVPLVNGHSLPIKFSIQQ